MRNNPMLASNRDTRNEESPKSSLDDGLARAVKQPGHKLAEGDVRLSDRGQDAVAAGSLPQPSVGVNRIDPSPPGRLRFLPKLSSGRILRYGCRRWLGSDVRSAINRGPHP